ncbi:hypothetical protein ACJJTC_005882 [Scirpophaga incertulas]
MARTGVAALSFAVLLTLFEIGSCIRCYQCNSQNDPKCRDPFTKESKLMDCTSQDSANYNNQFLRLLLPHDDSMNLNLAGATRYCHKIITNTGTVIRVCLDSNPINKNQTCHLLDAAALHDPSKRISHCSVCDTDGCNGVGAVAGSLPLAFVTILLSYIVYKQ